MTEQVELRGRKGTITGFATIDAVDVSLVAGHRWALMKSGPPRRHFRRGTVKQYARCNSCPQHDGYVLMHRLISGCPGGREVDHVNGNGLDNRRTNLRVVTHSEQMQNKQSHSGTTSSYRGVHWVAARKKWRAEIRLNGKNTFLGHFDDQESAALAASAARQRLMTHSVEGARQ